MEKTQKLNKYCFVFTAKAIFKKSRGHSFHSLALCQFQSKVKVKRFEKHIKMTFWQENFSFIKDVYDSRSTKLIELMDKTEKAMSSVLADKIYTSNEFKKIKESFIVRVFFCQDLVT